VLWFSEKKEMCQQENGKKKPHGSCPSISYPYLIVNDVENRCGESRLTPAPVVIIIFSHRNKPKSDKIPVSTK
jgi:hypothetical protein